MLRKKIKDLKAKINEAGALQTVGYGDAEEVLNVEA